MKKERVFLVMSFVLGALIIVSFQNCSLTLDSELGAAEDLGVEAMASDN